MVRLRPWFRLPLALLVTVTVQGATAAPARAMAHLRAISCCANTCHRADPLSDAKRCCIVQAGSDVATMSSAAQPQPPTIVGVLPLATAYAPVAAVRTAGHRQRPAERAGPIFLLTASLRL